MKITREDKLNEELMDIFNQEIVRELLSEEGAPTDDATVLGIWERCKPNPWDATIIYRLLQKL